MWHGIRLLSVRIGQNSFYRKFFLYSLSGSAAFSADYVTFLAVYMAIQRPYVANALGVCSGIIVSFTLNSRYTFQRRDAVVRRAAKFVAVALFGLALSSAIIMLLMAMGVDPRLGKMIAMFFVFVTQFAANTFWTFSIKSDIRLFRREGT
jgi:putative flippase GtrA